MDAKVSTQNKGPEDISIDDAYASFEKMISLKNQIENMSHKVESMANKFKVDPIYTRPEDFKIPVQDLNNISNFVLSQSGDFSTILQGLFGNNTTGAIYNAGMNSIFNENSDESEDNESDNSSIINSEADSEKQSSSSRSLVGSGISDH